MFALRLNQTIEERLGHIASVTGRSKHFYAVEAIETHLRTLEGKYLSPNEQAEVQARVDFGRIDMALAGELDPDLLNEVEHGHYFDASMDKFEQGALNPSEETKRFYASLSEPVGSCGYDENDVMVWRHADGTDKPYPPAK